MKKAIALVLSILSVVLLYCGCARMAAEHSIPDSSDNVANIEPSIPEASAEEPVIPTPTPATPTPEPSLTATDSPSSSPEETHVGNEEPNPYNAIIRSVGSNGEVYRGLLIGATTDGSWHTIDELCLPEDLSETPDIPYARGGETYHLYSKNGYVGSVVGAKPELHK